MTNPLPLEIVQAFFSFAETRDIDGMENILSDDFTHRILPESIGLPTIHKEQFLSAAKKTASTMETSNAWMMLTISMVHSFKRHKKLLKVLTRDGKIKNGDPYHNEYIFIFCFDAGQISSLKEFVDSKLFDALLALGGN
ncbi:hypothetical protein B0H10DRAFT_1776434 [Mycena sp. CBHHK59/15]|nr:hypothetical protein B0H10DRAFT_1776434 [Mycena sp. CBHHK59/15]